MHPRPILVSLALVQVAAAQTQPAYISPFAAASAFGNSNNSIPFSWTPTAYQQVHSLSSFNVQVPSVFTQMRLRMASGSANTAGKTIDVELYVAQCPTPSTGASPVFASNVVGTSEVNVFTRKMVNLPQVPNNSWAVAPFMFDVPFVWPATDLSWRTIVWGNSNNNQIFGYPLDAWWHINNGTSLGTGCKANNATSPSSHSSALSAPGRTSIFYGYSYINNSIQAFLALGTNSTLWPPLPLPWDLSPVGAPGCKVYIDWLSFVVGFTNLTGQVTYNIATPNVASLSGQTLYSQVVFIDPAANTLGGITTNGFTCKFGTDPGMTRIYATGSPSAISGTLDVGFGMAVGFN